MQLAEAMRGALCRVSANHAPTVSKSVHRVLAGIRAGGRANRSADFSIVADDASVAPACPQLLGLLLVAENLQL